jgi:hypothetical protein
VGVFYWHYKSFIALYWVPWEVVHWTGESLFLRLCHLWLVWAYQRNGHNAFRIIETGDTSAPQGLCDGSTSLIMVLLLKCAFLEVWLQWWSTCLASIRS